MTTGLVEKDIETPNGTVTYQFEQFNTTLALKTLTRLTKIIGEPLAIALGGAEAPAPGAGLLNANLSGDTLGAAMRALVDRLDEKEVIDLLRLLAAEKALCNGGKIIFDDHYRGDFGLLLKVFRAALEVQYGNFTAAVRARPHGATAREAPAQGIMAR